MQGMHSPKPRTRHSETCCGIVHQHSRELRNLRILREQKETFQPSKAIVTQFLLAEKEVEEDRLHLWKWEAFPEHSLRCRGVGLGRGRSPD